MPARYKNHRDGNEADLLEVFAKVGGSWKQGGPLDGWALFRGDWIPTEIKNPKGKNRYRKSQLEFIAWCIANNAPYWVWRTEDDVYNSTGALRQ